MYVLRHRPVYASAGSHIYGKRTRAPQSTQGMGVSSDYPARHKSSRYLFGRGVPSSQRSFHSHSHHYPAFARSIVVDGTRTLHWHVEPDAWGSDHLPILIDLHPHAKSKVKRKAYTTNWDKFRSLTADVQLSSSTLSSTLSRKLKEATTETWVEEAKPNPDLHLLNLWAARKRADIVARRNPDSLPDRIRVNRLTAKARQYQKVLSRERWLQWCDGMNGRTSNRALWRTFRAMENDRRPPDPVASSRLAAQETPEEFATRAARQFFPLHDVRHTLLQHPPPPAPDMDGLETPFTLPELIAAIECSKKRTTPGADVTPYEVYQNLEGNILNNILEIINETWTTATIPAEWKH